MNRGLITDSIVLLYQSPYHRSALRHFIGSALVSQIFFHENKYHIKIDHLSYFNCTLLDYMITHLQCTTVLQSPWMLSVCCQISEITF